MRIDMQIAISLSLLSLTSIGLAAPPAPLNDAQILGIYIQVNSFDIESALLGRGQSDTQSVRALAEHVATDHVGVRQAAQALAVQCNVTPALPADRSMAATAHDEQLITLLKLKGSAFDKAFLKYEVDFHRNAIAAVRTVLLPAAKCSALKTHLTEILPAFEQHLEHTQMSAREAGAL